MTTQQKTPALDFLRRVQVWQGAPGGTAGLAVYLADREEATLDGLLQQAQQPGASLGLLEVKARTWLVGYREMNPPLTQKQAAELDTIINQTASYRPLPPPVPPRNRAAHMTRPRLRVRPLVLILTAIAAALVVIVGVLAGRAITNQGSAPQLPAVFAPVQQNVPAGLTALQQFERDWDLPAVAQASAGNTGSLVLLLYGLYYPSPWAVPADDPGWAPDPGGHVVLPVQVSGGQVTFTDADGSSWTIGTGQPFTEASDPGTVLMIDASGHVLSMPASHAVAIRHRI